VHFSIKNFNIFCCYNKLFYQRHPALKGGSNLKARLSMEQLRLSPKKTIAVKTKPLNIRIY